MNIFLGILISVLAFALMIFIHEFGHFITAKLFKVKVNKFALGMGPALFKFGKGETEYSLRAFPIGGYCAMEGEDGESEEPRAFVNQKPWKRLIILVAGAAMNILLGLIIMSILVCQMPLLGTRYIANVPDANEGIAEMLQVGDEILEVNGKNVYITSDVDYIIALDNDGKADFLVRRDGEEIELKDVQLSLYTDEDSGSSGTYIDYGEEGYQFLGKEKTFFGVIGYSISETISTVRLVLYSFASLITGKIPIKSIGGPVAVTTTIVKNVTSGWKPILKLIGMISINLGVFNLFPLPALDGGRILFALIEMIIRRPVSRKVEGIIHTVGFILLLGLMALIFFKDILSLFI
ncbi:MAG: site-2 protease family protein [Clostridia bacterium]|nr:site-2 protease family protein [Clostridia bacterium]MBR5769196.1 site-2 protease family protein [Clostridia bacterium]